jgi:hypothetical protein
MNNLTQSGREPVKPISNYDGVGSGKVIDYLGRIFDIDRITGEYLPERKDKNL